MTAHKNTCAARFSESALSCTKIEHLIFLEFLFIKNKISKYSSAILLLTGMFLCRQKQKKHKSKNFENLETQDFKFAKSLRESCLNYKYRYYCFSVEKML